MIDCHLLDKRLKKQVVTLFEVIGVLKAKSVKNRNKLDNINIFKRRGFNGPIYKFQVWHKERF